MNFFNPCDFHIDPLITTVSTIVSGKTAKFDVSGVLTRNSITTYKTILQIGFADSSKNLIAEPYVQTLTESVSITQQYFISAKNVPIPGNLPDPYIMRVVVRDPTNDPNNPLNIFGFAYYRQNK
ncbi:hypothetical protein C2G38_2200020 [Gigaspora rosea]|uniref:Uncharacterized protein n=1 Tax=Gigaspora rosea TaxID=44941 RepID=A0A397UU24_9GLOM|nr:hypothetical protein C2G38_2200020 [Gigaspora rosea]